ESATAAVTAGQSGVLGVELAGTTWAGAAAGAAVCGAVNAPVTTAVPKLASSAAVAAVPPRAAQPRRRPRWARGARSRGSPPGCGGHSPAGGTRVAGSGAGSARPG